VTDAKGDDVLPLQRELTGIGRAWGRLADADPLWAICVDPEGRNGGWDPAAFFAKGAEEIERTLSRAGELGLPVSGRRALDFGCGAGRLTRPLAARFDLAVGVDISREMLDLAERDNPVAGRCLFVRNAEPDLAVFPPGDFDLVYSSIVLQHLTPGLIRSYLTEFARVVRPGGALIVHLPVRPRRTPRGLCYRLLPPPVLGLVQRRLLSYPAPMRMHGLPEREVRALLAAHDVDVLAADPVSYHPDWRELRYFCRRRPR
jgi:SAM-dependent methyltransferase